MIFRRKPVSPTIHRHHCHRLKNTLLASSLLALLASSGAMAQTIDGPVTTQVDLTGDASLVITTSGAVTVGAGTAVVIAPDATAIINNAGTIDGFIGSIEVLGGGTTTTLDLTNSGSIFDSTIAIYTEDADIVHLDNKVGGLIEGTSYGIFVVNGDLSNVTNDGQILSETITAIHLDDGNISGLTNSGEIIGSGGRGIYVASSFDALNNLAGGVIQGSTTGIELGLGGLYNFSNAGTIEGLTGDGIFLAAGGNINGLHNQAGGVIRGADDGISLANGSATNVTNDGEIHGGGGTGTSAIVLATLGGNLENFTNTGIVSNVGGGDYGAAIASTGTITNLNNSGKIVSLFSGNTPEDSVAIYGSGIASLTNSGEIIANLEGHAIYEDFGGDTLLTLLPGSVIQGRIDIEGAGASINTLVVGNGLSLATTFESALPTFDTNGTLLATTTLGGNLVAVADTSILASQDNALSETTGAVSNVLGEQLEMDYATQEQNWWIKGFGGLSQTSGEGAAAAVNHFYGGAVTGADAMVGDGLTAGLFGGFAAGFLDVAVKNGQNVDSMSYFAGGYGRFDADSFYLDFGLTAGMNTNSSERLVANNLVLGGLETATASYNSYFISPEITIGTDAMNTGDLGLKPSLRVRYSYQQSDGYTETGSVAPLTVGARSTQVIDARLQLAMPVNNLGADTMFELRTGIDGRFVLGMGDFDATLLGQTTAGFNPGGAQSSITGFVGADFSQVVSDTATIFASSEFGIGTETSFRVDAEAGVKISF